MYSVALLNGYTKRMDTPCQLQQHGLIGEWRDKRRRLFSEVLIMTQREKTILFLLLTVIFAFVNGDVETIVNEPVASVVLFSIWLVLGWLFVDSGSST